MTHPMTVLREAVARALFRVDFKHRAWEDRGEGEHAHYLRLTDAALSAVAPHIAERANIQDAWAAFSLLRETVETLGPVGALRSSERVACAIAPTFDAEAHELIRGIQRLVEAARVEEREVIIQEMRAMRPDGIPAGAPQAYWLTGANVVAAIIRARAKESNDG